MLSIAFFFSVWTTFRYCILSMSCQSLCIFKSSRGIFYYNFIRWSHADHKRLVLVKFAITPTRNVVMFQYCELLYDEILLHVSKIMKWLPCIVSINRYWHGLLQSSLFNDLTSRCFVLELDKSWNLKPKILHNTDAELLIVNPISSHPTTWMYRHIPTWSPLHLGLFPWLEKEFWTN